MNKTFTRTAIAAAMAVGLLAGASGASATPVIPGQSGALPTVIGVLGTNPFAGSTLLASDVGGDQVFLGPVRGFFWSAVYRNAAGLLDFYYQVRNDGTSIVERETDYDYLGFTTDVYQTQGGFGVFAIGEQVADGASRSVAGGTVSWDFNVATPGGTSGTLDPGETSYVKIIRTNAIDWSIGNTQIIDGGIAGRESFQPAGAPVPEPISMVLLGSGLVAVTRSVRRRRTQQALTA